MKDFDYCDKLHKNENLGAFSRDPLGLLWLKIKSILRVEFVRGFLEFTDYNINTKRQVDSFRELFALLSQDTIGSHKLKYSWLNNRAVR